LDKRNHRHCGAFPEPPTIAMRAKMKTFLGVTAALCCFLFGLTIVSGVPVPARKPAAFQSTGQGHADDAPDRDEDAPDEAEAAPGRDQQLAQAATDRVVPPPTRAERDRAGPTPRNNIDDDDDEEKDEEKVQAEPVDKFALDGNVKSPPFPSQAERDDDNERRLTEDADRRETLERESDRDEDDREVTINEDAVPGAEEPGVPPLPMRAPPVSRRSPRIASEPLGPPPPPQTWSGAEIMAAKTSCGRLVTADKYEFQLLDPMRSGACGAPSPISLEALKQEKEIELLPAVTVTCPLADAVDRWMREVVQPKAKEHLKDDVTGLVNVAAYHCRTRYNNPGERISYHAFAEAIDIAAFKTAGGQQISVEADWPGEGEKSKFLKEVHAGACKIFGTVLGPDANAAHRNHFHLDMAKRRFSSFCQ
jgi:hypothetical protein